MSDVLPCASKHGAMKRTTGLELAAGDARGADTCCPQTVIVPAAGAAAGCWASRRLTDASSTRPDKNERVNIAAAKSLNVLDFRRRLQRFGCRRRRTLARIALERKADGERGAAAEAGALGCDGAAVHLDDLARDAQAEAEAGVSLAKPTAALAELLEDVRQELGIGAGAVVLDADHGPPVAPVDSELDAAARGREVHRIVQQVAHDLLQPSGVAQHGDWLRFDLDLDVPVAGVPARRLDRRRRDGL